jgi:hypothetical protein
MIKVIDGTMPVWLKPYPVPLKNCKDFKNEVYCQCQIESLHKLTAEEIEEHEWTSPCFGVPKKYKTIRLVIDFCQLNRVMKWKEHPLPTIDEMFQNIRGFIFASIIDLNMGYLSIPLIEPTQKLLTIMTIFGYFACCVLRMGIKPATDMSQGCSQGYKPKTGPKQTQKENIPKQRKYKYFTSLKL